MSDTPIYDDLLDTLTKAQHARECVWFGCGSALCEPYCAGIPRDPWSNSAETEMCTVCQKRPLLQRGPGLGGALCLVCVYDL